MTDLEVAKNRLSDTLLDRMSKYWELMKDWYKRKVRDNVSILCYVAVPLFCFNRSTKTSLIPRQSYCWEKIMYIYITSSCLLSW